MPYTVEFKTSARKSFDALQGAVQTRISAVVDGLEENPRPPGCKKLKGRDNEYRIRVGDYRRGNLNGDIYIWRRGNRLFEKKG